MERSDLFKEQHRYPFETLHNLVAEYVLECHCVELSYKNSDDNEVLIDSQKVTDDITDYIRKNIERRECNNIIEYYDLAKNKKILKINRFDVYKYWKTSNNFNIKFLNNLNLSMPIDYKGFIDFFKKRR